jgi:hypothetical protein
MTAKGKSVKMGAGSPLVTFHSRRSAFIFKGIFENEGAIPRNSPYLVGFDQPAI